MNRMTVRMKGGWALVRTAGLTFALATAAMADSDIFPSQRPAAEKRLFRSAVVDAKIDEVCAKLENPKLAWLFENAFPNALDTAAIRLHSENKDDDTFVQTDGVRAMSLRDSCAQMWPYLALAKGNEPLRRLVRGVIRRQFSLIRIDPYANAFNLGPTGEGCITDNTPMCGEVFERKYALDSLCHPIRLAYAYWKATGDDSIFDDRWIDAYDLIFETMRKQQRKTSDANDYRFSRTSSDFNENMPFGTGWPAKPCGLIASGFRPSDDACILPFHVPSNFLAVDVLRKASEILHAVNRDDWRAVGAGALAGEVEAALRKYAVVRHPVCGDVYAYEVDGYGSALLMDDANVPSLLSLPYFSKVRKDDPIYRNTRRLVWSRDNPLFCSGMAGEGIGTPHCGTDAVCPLGHVLMALTSDDDDEIVRCLKALVRSDAGMGLLHESHHKDDVSKLTRPRFARANALFGELVRALYDRGRLDLLNAVK